MKYKLWIGAVMTVLCMMGMSTMMRAETTSLLTEPMLQNPTEDSVHVVWFTDSDTKNNLIVYVGSGNISFSVISNGINIYNTNIEIGSLVLSDVSDMSI